MPFRPAPIALIPAKLPLSFAVSVGAEAGVGIKRFKDASAKRDGGAFIKVPLAVLNSTAYLGLGAHARMLLFDLAAQYRGDNNGDLCAAWKVMRPRGWKSEDTVNRAKRALLASCLIVETRPGAAPEQVLAVCAHLVCAG